MPRVAATDSVADASPARSVEVPRLVCDEAPASAATSSIPRTRTAAARREPVLVTGESTKAGGLPKSDTLLLVRLRVRLLVRLVRRKPLAGAV
jgi:hypothetical protein